jgi:hypothetical protein
MFFAETQNKLLFAVTGHTAAEIIVQRADANSPNMNLSTWKGSVVRKADITIAKNYLNADEVDSLNRLTVIFLETAELRVKERKDLTINYWRENVDKLLTFNDKPILNTPGCISYAQMEKLVAKQYELFDARRKQQQVIAADARDLEELNNLAKTVSQKKRNNK